MPQPIRVAFLGPEGTFTHETARQWLAANGHGDAEPVLCPDRSASVDAVRAGEATYAVVAVATSLAGPMPDDAGIWSRTGVRVIDEVTRVCQYHLIGLPGAAVDAIVEVRSNQKAIDDCAARLRTILPRAGLVQSSSTAAGVASVATAARPDVAAIGTATAAAQHNLALLVENIEDDPANWTRWVIVERA